MLLQFLPRGGPVHGFLVAWREDKAAGFSRSRYRLA
jgi:hypothetical protein